MKQRILVVIIIPLLLLTGCLESPTISEPVQSPQDTVEQGEACTIGWKCLDKNRKGYQFPDCTFTQVNVCEGGCTDGQCLSIPSEPVEQDLTLTKGVGRVKKVGWKSVDFSKGQIFEDGVTKQDLKIQLYARNFAYTYFRVESSEPSIWVIDKGIAGATWSDCKEREKDAGTFHNLRTKQTACIKTKEKHLALIGGYWEGLPTELTKLNWKYYYPT